MTELPNPLEVRKADNPINDIFLKRWSPRAMSGEEVTDAELRSMFEAARWAPSSYNEQEWRFLYAGKSSAHWNSFFDLLLEANQDWCKNASHLVAIVARLTFTLDDSPNGVATLDCGAAMQNLLLQAAELGVVAHPMAGFHWDKASEVLQIPDGYAIQAMIALGKPGDPATLSPELAELEKPTGRKPLNEIVREGLFSF